MWQCPKCSVLHDNPGTHWKHLQDNPECMKKTCSEQDLKGWQGEKLDGPPVVRKSG